MNNEVQAGKISDFDKGRMVALKARFENLAAMIEELLAHGVASETCEIQAEQISIEHQQVARELERTLWNMGCTRTGHLGWYVGEKYYAIEPGMVGPPEFYQLVVGLKGRYDFDCPHCNKSIALMLGHHSTHLLCALTYACVGCEKEMTLAMGDGALQVSVPDASEPIPPTRGRCDAEDLIEAEEKRKSAEPQNVSPIFKKHGGQPPHKRLKE